jgi:hypothetical protein
MKYIDYIKILKEKNIILYDSDYRISYHRLIDLQELIDLKQIGGGDKNCLLPFFVIKKSTTKNTVKIIDLLLQNKIIESTNFCNI